MTIQLLALALFFFGTLFELVHAVNDRQATEGTLRVIAHLCLSTAVGMVLFVHMFALI